MEGTRMFDFNVKSRVHDYSVRFIEDTKESLSHELKEGDFIIIDRKIVDLYTTELMGILDQYQHIIIDATEKQKSYQELIPVIQYLIENGFRKNNRLVGIGGGITQDVTAFTSSILYRGVDWLFYPTSLLAQGDSCIGSKTSINFSEYKNQIGGFYPPNQILINPAFLETLPDSALQSGLGEMCHYFIVAGEEDFERFKREYPMALVDKKILSGIIARSLEIKKGYVEHDEFDQNKRQVFNYGHSFGHAIESLTNYDVPHGIAVSFGMDMANFVSVKLGLIPDSVRKNIRELLEKIWIGYDIKHLPVEKLKLALSKDKKNIGTKLGLILNKGYGNIFKASVDMNAQFTSWMEEYFLHELN
jgi:3-dehydroquinate synthase